RAGLAAGPAEVPRCDLDLPDDVHGGGIRAPAAAARHGDGRADPAPAAGGPGGADLGAAIQVPGLQRQPGNRGGRDQGDYRAALFRVRRQCMHDELKEEGIVNKVGGRFKLSTLIQKRMVALNTGARPLVDLKTSDKMAIVIQEILQDKIFLDASGQLQARGTSSGDAARRAMLTDVSDAGGAGGDD